jgi:hypothetical protein
MLRQDMRAAISLALLLSAATVMAAPQRPAGAPTGELAAEVHMRIGAGAILRAGGRTYPATPGTALLRNDELVVPAGQLLVVRLNNGYLVRLDDDVSLRVSQIVLIDAPRTPESIGSQLDRLLTKEEQGRAERIAGVHARMGGALDSGIGGEDILGRKSGGGGPSGGAASPSGGGAPPPRSMAPRNRTTPVHESPPSPPPVEAQKRTEKPAPPPAQAQAPAATAPAADPEVAEPKPIAPKLPKGNTAPPPPPSALPRESELRTCLARELGRLPVRLAAAPLRLLVAGGKITRAALGGGLRLPACGEQLLIGAPLQGPEGHWVDHSLPLR